MQMEMAVSQPPKKYLIGNLKELDANASLESIEQLQKFDKKLIEVLLEIRPLGGYAIHCPHLGV